MRNGRAWLLGLCVLAMLQGCGAAPDPAPTQTTAPTVIQTEATEPSKTRTVYLRTCTVHQTGDTAIRTDYHYDADDRLESVEISGDGDVQRVYQVTCDENGNPILWEGPEDQSRYTYDDAGNVRSYCVYSGETLISAMEYTWENGLRTAIERRMPGQGVQRTAMTYNSAGILIRQDDLLDGVLQDYSVFTLGDDGRPTVRSIYQADGTLSGTVQYTYDGSTVIATAGDGSVTEQCYDDHGNLLETTLYSADGTVTSRQTHSWKAIEVPLDCPRASI